MKERTNSITEPAKSGPALIAPNRAHPHHACTTFNPPLKKMKVFIVSWTWQSGHFSARTERVEAIDKHDAAIKVRRRHEDDQPTDYLKIINIREEE